MSCLSRTKFFIRVSIFFQLFHAILADKTIFESMSLDDRRRFFETADGSVPDFELAELTRPRRTKRRSEAIILYAMFNDTEFSTTLDIVNDNYLADAATTGIWFARSDASAFNNVTYTPAPEIFDRIGKLALYQNVEDCSAVTRFTDSMGEERYAGMVRQNYTVRSLPIPLQQTLDTAVWKCPIGKRSVNSMMHCHEKSSIVVIFKNPKISQEHFRLDNYGQSIPNLDDNKKRRQRSSRFNVPNVIYPKLLIVPDYTLTSDAKNVVDLVRHLITQFNTVDVLYRQLREPQVRLRIVGIIIPEDEYATPYIDPTSNGLMNESVTLKITNMHFRRETHRNFNYYNILIVITKNFLQKYDKKGRIKIVGGTASKNSACAKGVVIATHGRCATGSFVIAHQLGHVFGVTHDGVKKTKNCHASSGHTMVPDVKFLKTLKWSQCSKEAFQLFFRSRRAICLYRPPDKFPDSIKRLPGTWLSLDGQCSNKFQDSTGHCHMTFSCQTYGCLIEGSCIWLDDPPLQGTTIIGGMKCTDEYWLPIDRLQTIFR